MRSTARKSIRESHLVRLLLAQAALVVHFVRLALVRAAQLALFCAMSGPHPARLLLLHAAFALRSVRLLLGRVTSAPLDGGTKPILDAVPDDENFDVIDAACTLATANGRVAARQPWVGMRTLTAGIGCSRSCCGRALVLSSARHAVAPARHQPSNPPGCAWRNVMGAKRCARTVIHHRRCSRLRRGGLNRELWPSVRDDFSGRL